MMNVTTTTTTTTKTADSEAANSNPQTETNIVNGSHFMITNQALPMLDGQQVVFGKVTHGMEVVDRICNECGYVAPATSGTSKRVSIDECGQLA